MFGKKEILEKLSAFSYALYYMMIKSIESYAVIKNKLYDPKHFIFWHDYLVTLDQQSCVEFLCIESLIK